MIQVAGWVQGAGRRTQGIMLIDSNKQQAKVHSSNYNISLL